MFKTRKIKLFLTSVFSLLVAAISLLLYSWGSPGINWESKKNAWRCIYTDPSRQEFNFKDFKVNLVEHSSPKCINPDFPTIHIQTKQPHNAWLHIVYTDSTNVSLKVFIDSTNQHKKDSPYPFYSFGKDFYDTPIWKYNLLSKPLNYWKGHAWAVTVDRRNKTIKPIGGISWGFKLSYFKLRPELIPLSPLDMQTWESDWLVFQTKLKNFKVNVAAHSSPYCVS